MQKKKWLYKNIGINKDRLHELSAQMSVSPVTLTLLMNRGYENETDIMWFLKKPMSGIHPPFLLDGVEKAAERILKAVEDKEKIVIYGDYDVDGVTSTVLLYKFLKSIGADVRYYIPERANEGYGINMIALNKLIKSGAKLLITVDCGITAVGEVEFARLQGMEVIITDHHNCQEKLPQAYAVINPKIPESSYPFDSLAGVGVAFKLVLGIAVKAGMNTKEVFDEYSDLAAVGTLADLVPLRDENRIIVDRGLKKLREGRGNAGIRALLEISGADKHGIGSSAVAFSVAPRLNASGRLGSAAASVELLIENDREKAVSLAKGLDEENKERQLTELEIFNEAMQMIAYKPELAEKKVIVLSKEDWHQGVIGIVASRICERFYKPAILISTKDGSGRGSGRSIPGFNLFEALGESKEYLKSFGGHSVAAGVNIRTEDIEDFAECINKYADMVLGEEDMIPTVKIDCEIPSSLINVKNIKFISSLEPFGIENEAPVFSLSNVNVINFGAVGIDAKHLRMTVKMGDESFNCVGFGMGEYVSVLKVNDYVDIAFNMEINNFREHETIQLKLKDIHIK